MTTMDMKLPSTSFAAASARALRPALDTKPLGVGAGSGAGGISEAQAASFANALKGALKSVSASQNHATSLQREVTMENPKVSLEETMVAIQKAQIGFQATLHVRNRMVQAYSDIMNMQV
jgi:flagellar hook-basal body complex protein FliE